MSDYTPCGGCGADNPSQRCIGCLHNFGGDSIAQTVSDAPTPETDAYIGTHETHRINGRNIYDHARELERELNAARAYSVELTAKYLEASGEIQAERSELRARVAELELNLMRATMIVERAMEKTSLGWTIPGFVEQFKRLLAKKA